MKYSAFSSIEADIKSYVSNVVVFYIYTTSIY